VKLLVRRADQLELLGECGIVTVALLLDLLQLGVDLLEGVADRLHELADRLLARLEIEAGLAVLLAERALGDLEERLVVLAESFRRKRLEGVSKLCLGLRKKRLLLGARPALLPQEHERHPGRDGAARNEADEERQIARESVHRFTPQVAKPTCFACSGPAWDARAVLAYPGKP
jgi:hypothetical protein